MCCVFARRLCTVSSNAGSWLCVYYVVFVKCTRRLHGVFEFLAHFVQRQSVMCFVTVLYKCMAIELRLVLCFLYILCRVSSLCMQLSSRLYA